MPFQTTSFDPKFGPMIPVPLPFTMHSVSADECTIYAVLPDTAHATRRTVEITFRMDGAMLARNCRLRTTGVSDHYDWKAKVTTKQPWSRGVSVLTDWVLRSLAAGVDCW